MAIDNTPVLIAQALKWAKEYYSKDKYEHALRVMQNIADNDVIPYEYREDCIALAIMHDLIEDTQFTSNGLPDNFRKALMLLTKSKDKNYIDYIKDIHDVNHINWRMCAWWVKLADIKDHLSQTETLTDKLKDKYLSALPYLL